MHPWVKSIYDLLSNPRPFSEEKVAQFTHALTERIRDKLSEERATKPSLRLSMVGGSCDRETWYKVNTPEDAEPLPPAARLKFLYGDILEELILFLLDEAGHKVTDRQKTVTLNGVEGHIDGYVDGVLADVKSSSTPGMVKFHDNRLWRDDPFGYLGQLGSYATAESTDKGSFIAVDKTTGEIVVDTYDFSGVDYRSKVEAKKQVVEQATPPPRGFNDEPFQASGNRALGLKCSYCSFKGKCWPGLKVALYSRSPVFLTKITKAPQSHIRVVNYDPVGTDTTKTPTS